MPRKSKRRTRRRTRRKRGGLPCLAWHPRKGPEYEACIAKRAAKKARIVEHGYDPEGKRAKGIKNDCTNIQYLDRVYNNLEYASGLHTKYPDYYYAKSFCGPWNVGLVGCRKDHGVNCTMEIEGEDGEKRIIPIKDHSAMIDADHVHQDGFHQRDIDYFKGSYNNINDLTEKQIKAVEHEKTPVAHGGRWPARSSGPTNKKGSRKKTKKKRTKNKTKKKRRKKRRRKRRR